MSSGKSLKLLQDSTKKHTYGSTSNAGPSTETKPKTICSELTLSAPAVLEPSKDASRPSKPRVETTLEDSSSPPINPWRTLVTCSCPEPLTRVPIGLDDERNEAHEQQLFDEPQMRGRHSICSALITCYKSTAIMLRKSVFIHILQAIFSVLQVSGIVMGAMFDGKCNESELLPAYGSLTGVIGIVFIGFWMSISCYHRLDRSSSDIHKLLFTAIFLVFTISVIMEISFFSAMSCNFDQESPNYCHKTFYYYSFYKHILTGATAAVAMILYFPGSLHYVRCHCFSGADRVL